MPSVLLQKPSYKSNSKQHSLCLARRLKQWENGDFDSIMRETRTIQTSLKGLMNRNQNDEALSKNFAKLIFEGKVNAALRLLDKSENHGVLPLTQTTIDELKLKHPTGEEADEQTLIRGPEPFIDPVLFENLDESAIRNAALRTRGSSGPSGLDADGWKRILVSKYFGNAGVSLRVSIANFAWRLCTVNIDSNALEAYTACRLIPLDKSPGVRPIGIGEVLRRIIGKAVISLVKRDIIDGAGDLQMCAGQSSGCEAAVHAISEIFEEQATDGLLLVDASNAFNALNRKVLLHNIKYLCPAMSTYVTNCYRKASRLFVVGGLEISSCEGTTQGDPLAMPVYAIGVTPLLDYIKPRNGASTRHAAFADDFAGAGDLRAVREWWDLVVEHGPKLGYYPNAEKSWLIIKPDRNEEAKELFGNTNINITTQGRKYLGGYIGEADGEKEYSKKLVDKWCDQIVTLSKIARCEPQAAYAAFVGGFRNRLTYHMRTISALSNELRRFDDLVDSTLIPAITDGYSCTRDERILLSLPAKKGGLAIPIFSALAVREYSNSRKITASITNRIKQQNTNAVVDDTNTIETRKAITKSRNDEEASLLNRLRENMTVEKLRANDLSCLKGASSWLTPYPLKRDNLLLNKREFTDAVRLRYRWQLKYLPAKCACGKQFTVDHAMSCAKGGFIHQRHDDVRDMLAHVLNDVCNDVQTEPHLQPLTGENLPANANTTEEARLDIRARSFWQRGQLAFFDVKVFNPYAKSHLTKRLEKAFEASENEKKRKYNQRIIEVEHGSFSPIVVTPYGGSGRETDKFLQELAKKLAAKMDLDNSRMIQWLRTKLSFTLLRSAILCIRGSRTIKKQNINLQEIELSTSY